MHILKVRNAHIFFSRFSHLECTYAMNFVWNVKEKTLGNALAANPG